MFHRETDAAKVARNRDALFDLHARSLAWLEAYTSIPYPWGKFDFVLIPSFQFGGMEHAGAILYNASGLMLDESATQNQLLERASVIAHETAHMWFGDLVTMRWFDDVWMKEVFANFMAAKIVNPSFPDVNHELRFLLAHHPGAYQVDRTSGTNPIRQPLSNLDDAGQMYGAIIYQKAPVVMRQLELIVGENAFRDGLREYLERYSYGNATWSDLIRILDARTKQDLVQWSRAWVEERGRPTVSTSVRVDERGQVEGLDLTMADPLDRGLVWPERLHLVLGYADAARRVPVDVTRERTAVRLPRGLDKPLYVLPSGDGLGYGLFLLDETSRDYLLAHVERIPEAVTRGAAWVTMWDNLVERRVSADALLATAMRALPEESDEQNAQRVLAYTTRMFWRYLSPDQRRARGTELEGILRAGIGRGRTQSQKSAWFNAYRDTVLSTGRSCLARAGMEAGRSGSRTDAGRARRDCAGARTGRPPGAPLGGDPAPAGGAYAESGSQGSLRVRHAVAVGGPGGPREGVCTARPRGEPAARAVGARVAPVPQSSASRSARQAIRPPGARPAARDPADR